ncbi:MAG: efflux transporter outer membrane subunit [Thermoanaerobaculia bacterium]
MKARVGVFVPAGIALLLAGCAVGPNYKRPSAPVPPDWKEQGPPSAATAGEWKPAEPRENVSRGKWWTVFGDSALDGLEDQVALSNQNVAQAEAAYRAARAVARGARGDFFPVVGGNASATRSEGAATGVSTGSRVESSFAVSADLSWEIDLWGRIRRSVEAGVAAAQASEADLESARLSYQAQLAADYFNLRGVDAQIDLLDTTAAAYEKALKLTTDRFHQGVVSAVDVAQAQTQLSTTRAQAIDLGLTRAQLEHAIAVLVGKSPAELSLPPAPLTEAPPEIPVEVPSQLLERRPDIASAERQVASANARIGVAIAAFFPTLGLSGSGGYTASAISDLFTLPSRFWSIGASLVGTIFEGGKRRAAREQAQAQWEGAVAGYRQTVLSAFQEVEDDLAALRILSEEAVQQADAVAAAEHALSLAQTRYRGGITSYLEVITAQSSALADERVNVELRARRMTSAVDLVKALGGGWRDSDLPTGSDVLSRRKAAEPRLNEKR